MASSKALLVLTVAVLLIDGHAPPRMREVRNPDAEGATGGRTALTVKRIRG